MLECEYSRLLKSRLMRADCITVVVQKKTKPGSQVTVAQKVVVSSELSPQSLSPSHSQRRMIHTLVLPHFIRDGGHVIGAGIKIVETSQLQHSLILNVIIMLSIALLRTVKLYMK